MLDLFSGSGVVGLESASRGAGHVVFVDASPVCAKTIRANCEALGLRGASVACTRAEQFLAKPEKYGEEQPFHLVTATPPYDEVSGPRASKYGWFWETFVHGSALVHSCWHLSPLPYHFF